MHGTFFLYSYSYQEHIELWGKSLTHAQHLRESLIVYLIISDIGPLGSFSLTFGLLFSVLQDG